MRVDEVCKIQSGYTVRERLLPSPMGVLALSLRHVTDQDDWAQIEPERFQLGAVKVRYFARPGDVLFRSRGLNTTASAIPEDWGHLAVTILPLLLLKPVKTCLRPAFLSWSLNQPDAQRHFDRYARGTSLRMVPRPVLAELRIDVPDLKAQDAILEANRLAEQAYALERKSAKLRRSLSRLQLAEAARINSETSSKGA